MKLHNPLTGVQVSVEDDEGDRMLATGAWVEGDTPSDWTAPKLGETPAFTTTTTSRKAKAAAKTGDSSDTGNSTDPGGSATGGDAGGSST